MRRARIIERPSAVEVAAMRWRVGLLERGEYFKAYSI